MRNPEIAQILADDHWSVAHGMLDVGPFILRFREPLRSVNNTTGYSRLLTILWPYADEGSGALPSPDDVAALDQFEDRLCAALEHDGRAIVTAVLTLDGARQWIVYTDDIPECGQRITDMPQNEEPYPIQMDARDDPGWEYLHQEVLQAIL